MPDRRFDSLSLRHFYRVSTFDSRATRWGRSKCGEDGISVGCGPGEADETSDESPSVSAIFAKYR